MDALQADGLAIDHARIDRAGAGERADDIDRAARAHGVYGFFQCAGAANLEHVVDTGAAGPLADGFVPIGRRLVIDQRVGAERFGVGELLLAARGQEYKGAVHFRKGEAKHETPPVPRMAIVSPALMPPVSTKAFHAVSAAQGKVAASAKLR